VSRTTALVALSLLATGCIVGSGQPAKELRSVGAYDSVTTSDSIDVRLATDLAADELEVRCDDNLIDLIQTEVSGGELRVKVQGHTGVSPKTTCEVATGRWDVRGLHTSGSGDIHGEGPFFALAELTSSGSGDIRVRQRLVEGADEAEDQEGFVSDEEDSENTLYQDIPETASRVSLRTSGSGDAHLSGIEASRVHVRTSGSGDVHLAGGATSLNAQSSGSGDISAKDLRVEQGVLRTSGSGDVRGTVTESVDASSSGSGDITIWGKPGDRSRNSTGSGDILFR
jgi:hypothetical protein